MLQLDWGNLSVPGKWADMADGMAWEQWTPTRLYQIRPSSVPVKKEAAHENVKHEATNYDSLEHRHCGVVCESKWMHLQINIWGKLGP